MNVLIGIPTHKRPELLRACLDSIAAQSGPDATVRLFVADNDSAGREGHDLVRRLVPEFRFPLSSAVVAEPGISAVRNAILAEARRSGADFVAMIDDDETASPNWLSELLRVQAAFGADAVGGPVIRDMPAHVPPWLRAGIFRPLEGQDRRVPILQGTGNLLVCCRTLERLGWPTFHPGFALTGGEDAEWFTQLQRRGASFALAMRAVTVEPLPPERTRLPWLLKRSFTNGSNQVRILRLHGSRPELGWKLLMGAGVLAAAPLLSPGLLNPRLRLPMLLTAARAAGRISGLVGFHYREYAGRHVALAQAR